MQGCVCTHSGSWLLARDKGHKVRGGDQEDKVWGNGSTKNQQEHIRGDWISRPLGTVKSSLMFSGFVFIFSPLQWLLDTGEDSCRICKVLHCYC